ncbi:ABC transporter ATP-binding protein [Myceligenerans pegani]|uniref:ATP-binding cassette domain-containing protein n=1 Tax=Myceligenerans pegani TaxID=2776917 RepID=A0ABR9N442_9MICO|nr:ATP-binding cassette domain-containing protein [Myceligenerans sp. TRM 65318]MBE1878434.1 ATP-binding cassette domain-containing protein [Myceligenerans sp. TRM 65318]MBE3020705.1 ATP-binding cassette domain-containing protein [Myceligenerans sp. TRM 65318]
MIELRNLTKRYGDKTAVDELSLTLEPGTVTGFLGPNGAGKSTTMRLILGLDAPTSGTATIGGRRYADLRRPLRTIGALLDAKAVHPGRTGRDHLRAMARSQDLPARRVAEVLELTGMTAAARRRAGTYSLGMSQRLGIAGALLGDPRVLMLDEPVNGLDPDGVRWIRTLLRGLAAEGRTVFVSSHLMSEMEQTADRLIVLGRGRLVADEPMSALLTAGGTVVRGPDLGPLAAAVEAEAPGTARWTGDGATSTTELTVSGRTPEEVGALAHRLGLPLHGLAPAGRTLEESYMNLTAESIEYEAATPAGGAR